MWYMLYVAPDSSDTVLPGDNRLAGWLNWSHAGLACLRDIYVAHNLNDTVDQTNESGLLGRSGLIPSEGGTHKFKVKMYVSLGVGVLCIPLPCNILQYHADTIRIVTTLKYLLWRIAQSEKCSKYKLYLSLDSCGTCCMWHLIHRTQSYQETTDWLVDWTGLMQD